MRDSRLPALGLAPHVDNPETALVWPSACGNLDLAEGGRSHCPPADLLRRRPSQASPVIHEELPLCAYPSPPAGLKSSRSPSPRRRFSPSPPRFGGRLAATRRPALARRVPTALAVVPPPAAPHSRWRRRRAVRRTLAALRAAPRMGPA